ncbi:hypothetical protein QTP86_018252, partial [Hemibagrus guttatus]
MNQVYSDRVQYLTDEQNHFSLRLSDVKKTDEHMYYFRITTNEEKERFLGFPGVTLTVTDRPKKVSLSFSPSGEIVEGSSVTLTCSSDANPPVKNYTWYKGILLRMSSVSISPSGEIVEGSSVTLTCSSDAKPPVKNYTWFKVNESSPVGSGQSYRAVQSGQYYCEAQNKHGSERSAAVSVTVNGSWILGLYAGLGAVLFVCICLTVTFLCIRKKKIACSTADQSLRQDNLYSTVAVTNPTDTVSDSASANQDEVLYASVVHRRAVDPGNAESSAVKASASEDGDVQYTSVRFKRTADEY